jgi:hypothetical protein
MVQPWGWLCPGCKGLGSSPRGALRVSHAPKAFYNVFIIVPYSPGLCCGIVAARSHSAAFPLLALCRAFSGALYVHDLSNQVSVEVKEAKADNAVTCIHLDAADGRLWTGHKKGYIRCAAGCHRLLSWTTGAGAEAERQADGRLSYVVGWVESGPCPQPSIREAVGFCGARGIVWQRGREGAEQVGRAPGSSLAQLARAGRWVCTCSHLKTIC